MMSETPRPKTPPPGPRLPTASVLAAAVDELMSADLRAPERIGAVWLDRLRRARYQHARGRVAGR